MLGWELDLCVGMCACHGRAHVNATYRTPSVPKRFGWRTIGGIVCVCKSIPCHCCSRRSSAGTHGTPLRSPMGVASSTARQRIKSGITSHNHCHRQVLGCNMPEPSRSRHMHPRVCLTQQHQHTKRTHAARADHLHSGQHARGGHTVCQSPKSPQTDSPLAGAETLT